MSLGIEMKTTTKLSLHDIFISVLVVHKSKGYTYLQIRYDSVTISLRLTGAFSDNADTLQVSVNIYPCY